MRLDLSGRIGRGLHGCYCSPNKNVNQAAYFVSGAKKKEAMREGVLQR